MYGESFLDRKGRDRRFLPILHPENGGIGEIATLVSIELYIKRYLDKNEAR
jgi:hypothetical protein